MTAPALPSAVDNNPNPERATCPLLKPGDNPPMKISPDVETRARSIGGTRTEPGIEFQIPRPFQPEHFEALTSLGVDAGGAARSFNQLLAENVTNNIGSKIKSIRDYNDTLEAAQNEGKRLEDEPRPFPTQTDVDEYIAAYDFSGVRESTGESTAMSIRERELWKLAKRTIREILKSNNMKVAKKDEEPADGEVSWDQFESMAGDIVHLNGAWGDPSVTVTDPNTGEEIPAYYNKAQELHEIAAQAEKSAKDNLLTGAAILKAA